MARTVFVFRDGDWVDKETARPLHLARDAPMIRPDGMDPIVSQADGKTYDSRSAYYGDLKARGLEICPDRNVYGQPREFRSQGVEQAIKRAMAQHGMGD